VRGGILITNRTVGRCGEYGAIANDNGSDRYFVPLDRFAGEIERIPHVLLVNRERRCGKTELFACRPAICRQALALSLS
jgi:hypothetical protein